MITQNIRKYTRINHNKITTKSQQNKSQHNHKRSHKKTHTKNTKITQKTKNISQEKRKNGKK